MRQRAAHRAGRRRERLSARRALERHVVEVQRTVRTCQGCGQCCTEGYNAVKILPVEAGRIARHLAGLPTVLRAELVERVERAVAHYGLRAGGPKRRYTCPFLDPSLGCALPLQVKPTACLSFNPLDPDRCEQEPEWYFPAHDAEERANRAAGLPGTVAPIPVAVLAALRGCRSPPPEPPRECGRHGRRPRPVDP